MRIHYYRFPDETSEDILLENGCAVITVQGQGLYVDNIPEEHRKDVDHIDTVLGGLSITAVKKLIKQYGGIGWTEHCERDGGVFEVTPIVVGGNNSWFKYNHHL